MHLFGDFTIQVEHNPGSLVCLRDGIVNDMGNAGDKGCIFGVAFVRVFHKNNQIAPSAIGQVDAGCIVIGYG